MTMRFAAAPVLSALLLPAIFFSSCAAGKPGERGGGPGNELVSTGPGLPGKAPAGRRPWAGRFEKTFRRFEEEDAAYPVSRGAVVFIGDGLVASWKGLFQDMRPLSAVNRGVEGAGMKEILGAADWFVIPYEPQMVVVRAGLEDLASGRSPREVFALFRAFAAKVRRALPKTGIFFLSLLPGPERWFLREKAREVDRALRKWCKGRWGMNFLDLAPAMLDEEGRPRPLLYADGRRPSRRGYILLKALLKPLLLQGRETYEPYPDPRFYGKVGKIRWQDLTARDLEELPLLSPPRGTSPEEEAGIRRLVDTVGRTGEPAARVFRAYKKLADIGYEAVPAVINKIVRLDYTRRDDVVRGALYFDLLKDMCGGVGLEFHGAVLPGSDFPPPWENGYDINWNRGAALQWYRFWVRYGTDRETWRRTLLGIPRFPD